MRISDWSSDVCSSDLPDLLNSVSQKDIEQKAAEIVQSVVGAEIAERKRRKAVRISEYVTNDAPWHRVLANEVDFNALPMRHSNQDIALPLQKKKYEKEKATRRQVTELLTTTKPDALGRKNTKKH